MVVAATEWSDGTLPAALADDLTARLAEVLDVLRVESTFEVFDSRDSGERVLGFGGLTLLDAEFDAVVFDVGGCPEFDVELAAHRWVVMICSGAISLRWI